MGVVSGSTEYTFKPMVVSAAMLKLTVTIEDLINHEGPALLVGLAQ